MNHSKFPQVIPQLKNENAGHKMKALSADGFKNLQNKGIVKNAAYYQKYGVTIYSICKLP